MAEAFRGIRGWQIAALFAVVLVGLGAVYGGYAVLNTSESADLAEDQQLIPVTLGDLVNEVAINGSLVYPNRDTLTFGIQGTVGEVLVEEGQRVEEGQPLARLDNESITRLEKEVAQAEVGLRDAQDGLAAAQSPFSRLDLAQAEAKVANSTVSLDESEENLATLLAPPSQDLAKAEAKVSNAKVTLAAAEDALARLLSPTEQAVAQAETKVAGSKVTLAAAEDALARLLSPTDQAVAQAEAKVAGSKDALSKAKEAVATLLEPADQSVAQAQTKITKAKTDLADAREALAILLKPGAEEVAQLEVNVAISKKTLEDAKEALAMLLAPDSEEIARAEVKLTDAKLALENKSTTLADLRLGASEDDVAKVQAQVDSASVTVANARLDTKLTQKEWDEKLGGVRDSLESASEEYRLVFVKWLGIDFLDGETQVAPDSLLESWDVDLTQLFDTASRFYDVGRSLFTLGIPRNDPATRLDESVIYTWVNFYPGEISATCDDGVVPFQGLCIKKEMDDAWDGLTASMDALDTVETQAARALSNADSAVDKTEESLTVAQEALATLREDAEPLIIEQQEKQLELAIASLRKAEGDLAEIKGGPDEFEVGAAEKQVALAEAKLKEAEVNLAALIVPDPLDVETRQKRIALAEADLEQAKTELAELIGADPLELERNQKQVSLAEADLHQAETELAELIGADPLELERNQKQVSLAEADLQQAETDLAELIEPDPAEVEAKQKQIALNQAELEQANADLAELAGGPDPLGVEAEKKQVALAHAVLEQAEDDLKELLAGPDPIDIALREADVASGQALLEAAAVRLQNATIRAPWDGIVSVVNVEAKESVNPNNPVMEIVDPTVIEVEGIVDEIDVLFIREGARASVAMDALAGQTLGGSVSTIATTAQTQQGVVSYPISIVLETPQGLELPEGLSAVATVTIREDLNVILVPLNSLYGSFEQPVVRVMNGGEVEDRVVLLGNSDEFWVIVEQGLVEGELIVMQAERASTAGGFAALRGAFGGGPGGFGGGGFGRGRGGGGGGGGGGARR